MNHGGDCSLCEDGHASTGVLFLHVACFSPADSDADTGTHAHWLRFRIAQGFRGEKKTGRRKMPVSTMLSAWVAAGRSHGVRVMSRYCCCWFQRGVDSHGELDFLRTDEDGDEFTGAAIRRGDGENRITGAESPETVPPETWNSSWATGWMSSASRVAATSAAAKAGTARKASRDPVYERMADEDIFGEAGLPCSICTSETRLNSHFAVPCRYNCLSERHAGTVLSCLCSSTASNSFCFCRELA
jgi:hypothetical protein